MASGFIDGAPTSSKIPVEYLNCVEIRAYHVEFALAVETATFSGRVRISVHIAGAPRRVLYLHAAGLELASAMINGAPASVVKGDASLVRLEMPVDGAVAGDQVRLLVGFSTCRRCWKISRLVPYTGTHLCIMLFFLPIQTPRIRRHLICIVFSIHVLVRVIAYSTLGSIDIGANPGCGQVNCKSSHSRLRI